MESSSTATPQASSMGNEENPFEAMMQRFDRAAELLELDRGIYKILRHPEKQIIVSVPVLTCATILSKPSFMSFRACIIRPISLVDSTLICRVRSPAATLPATLIALSSGPRIERMIHIPAINAMTNPSSMPMEQA